MIRKTLLLILPAAMVMAGCTKKGEEPQPGPEPTPTPVVVSQITVNLESLEVSPDSLSVIDLQVTPADALIAIDDKGLCPDLSFESLKSAMNGSEVNAVTGVRIRKVAQVDSAGVKKPGAYLVTVSGDSSNIYLKDSVRMTYRTSKETLVSKGFDVISKASRTLPTQIQVQSDLVALKSDSVSTLSISVFPSGAKLNIGSDGKCEGLNLVLDGSSETPSEYHIAKVEETPNSQGGGVCGSYPSGWESAVQK